MNHVYLVEESTYEDTCVIGIYTTREKAMAAIRGKMTVRPMMLDGAEWDEAVSRMWQVIIDARTDEAHIEDWEWLNRPPESRYRWVQIGSRGTIIRFEAYAEAGTAEEAERIARDAMESGAHPRYTMRREWQQDGTWTLEEAHAYIQKIQAAGE